MTDPPNVSRRTVIVALASLPFASACSASVAQRVTNPSAVPATHPAATHAVASPTTAATTASLSEATEVARGTSATGVALTFHGSGSPTLADDLLRVAESHHAHVTVMAVGAWLEQYPAIGHRIVNAGHELGNHTLHHLQMLRLSERQAVAEILGCERLVRAVTGNRGWFRPSATIHATPTILRAAAKAGYHTSIAYDVDPRDYTEPGAALVAERVLSSVRGGSIVSLHLGHSGTVLALPSILKGLAQKKLVPMTLSQLLPTVTA